MGAAVLRGGRCVCEGGEEMETYLDVARDFSKKVVYFVLGWEVRESRGDD